MKRFWTTIVVAVLAATPFVFANFFASSAELWVKVVVAAFFVLGTGTFHYLKDVRPLLAFSEKKNSIIQRSCSPALEALRRFDDTARMNIMEVDKTWPGSRSKFIMVHTFNMQNAPDVDLKPRINRGPWGRAKDGNRLYVADLENEDLASHDLDAEHLEKMEGLTLIFSMPIRKEEKKRDGRIHITRKVIGMVNVDSRHPDALAFYRRTRIPDTNKTLYDEMEEVLGRISEVCTWVMS